MGRSALMGSKKCINFTLEQATKAQKGLSMYTSTLSLTSALDGVGARPGRFTSEKETWYPLYRMLDGPQDRSVWCSYRYSISGPSSSSRVAMSTTLSRPTI